MLEHPGRPPSLVVRDVPVPVPASTEALVQVMACGFCHHDLLVMAGVLRRGVKPQVVLGHEISGVVVEVGSAVTHLRPGDYVVSLLTNACGQCDRCRRGREHRCHHGSGIGHSRDGGFAEYVAIAEASLVTISPDPLLRKSPLTSLVRKEERREFPPQNGVFEDFLYGAALFGCPIGVVLQAVQQVAQLHAGETVLVTGAGGGLGVHAVQVAVHLGARVLAVTSSPEKVPHLARLGATEVLEVPPVPLEVSPNPPLPRGDARGVDFSELALALTEDQGVDVVIDTVGAALFPATWRSLSQYGRLLLLGEVTGRPVELNLAEVTVKKHVQSITGKLGVSDRTQAAVLGVRLGLAS